MRTKLLLVSLLFVFLTSWSQGSDALKQVRINFQNIKNADDIKVLTGIEFEGNDPDSSTVMAYQGAGTCMMAEYVSSPAKKLKYFNQGKKVIQTNIEEEKTVEKVYVRLMIQLNIPKFLNYHKEIDGDVKFLEENFTEADIDLAYKSTMINNLLSSVDEPEMKENFKAIPLTD